ncbi:MAG: hypothetical protein LBJ01_12135, partial [Tannerella sp.]|nr:hypothetical protein [Tannerella sp.]
VAGRYAEQGSISTCRFSYLCPLLQDSAPCTVIATKEAIAEPGSPKQSVPALAIASYLAMTARDRLKCARFARQGIHIHRKSD